MRGDLVEIDKLLIDVFDDISAIEEHTLKMGCFSGVTVKETHTVEAIGLHCYKTAGEVAKALGITLGTLTAAVNSLIKKGYVDRKRSEEDRRIVELSLTSRGRLLYRAHRDFHKRLVSEAVSELKDEEAKILSSSLGKLHVYLETGYKNIR